WARLLDHGCSGHVSVPGSGTWPFGRLSGPQLHAERGACALARDDPDRAVHQPHELAADVEPETGAAHAAGQIRVEAVELLEDPALLGERDAEPLVAHGDTYAVAPGDGHLDATAVRRVFDRVVDEVRQHLAQ